MACRRARCPPDSLGFAAQRIDIEAVLSARPEATTLDWHHSIVDLLKLLDLDSRLTTRRELAGELNVHAAADGTTEQSIALHKAVMRASRKWR